MTIIAIILNKLSHKYLCACIFIFYLRTIKPNYSFFHVLNGLKSPSYPYNSPSTILILAFILDYFHEFQLLINIFGISNFISGHKLSVSLITSVIVLLPLTV